jgi:hypothetical protein
MRRRRGRLTSPAGRDQRHAAQDCTAPCRVDFSMLSDRLVRCLPSFDLICHLVARRCRRTAQPLRNLMAAKFHVQISDFTPENVKNVHGGTNPCAPHVTGTYSSMAATPPRRLPVGARSQRSIRAMRALACASE